jgi:hypothetical protein
MKSLSTGSTFVVKPWCLLHSQLHISLKIPKKENALTADENERSERNQARKWCSEKSQEYLQNLVSDGRCLICLSCFMKSLSTGSTFAVKSWCLFSPYI